MPTDYEQKVNRFLELGNNRKLQAQQKVNQFYKQNAYNPFTDKNGRLKNRNIDYQQMLNSSKVSNKVKNFISQATGLTPIQPSITVQEDVSPANIQMQEPILQNNATTKKQTNYPNVSENTTNSIVNAATKYIGTPYVWGGESAAEGGMDCSGFVYNALKDAGYKVGRTTAQGYRSYGNAVNKSEMQPGDLVFYGSGNKASHIGIYIGNGQIVQSSGGKSNTKSNPGKGVSIKNIDYRNDFLEARRY